MENGIELFSPYPLSITNNESINKKKKVEEKKGKKSFYRKRKGLFIIKC
jgi:hypothetical protein